MPPPSKKKAFLPWEGLFGVEPQVSFALWKYFAETPNLFYEIQIQYIAPYDEICIVSHFCIAQHGQIQNLMLHNTHCEITCSSIALHSKSVSSIYIVILKAFPY